MNTLCISPSTYRHTTEVSRRLGVNPLSTLLVAFQTLLHRYSQAERITVQAIRKDSPGGNDSHAGFELTTDFSGDEPFRTLLERAQESPAGASLRSTEAIQATFTVNDATVLSSISRTNTQGQLELRMTIEENGTGLTVQVEGTAGQFEPVIIERMPGHYRTLLEAAIANPDISDHKLPLLTETERRQVLVAWNATDTDYP